MSSHDGTFQFAIRSRSNSSPASSSDSPADGDEIGVRFLFVGVTALGRFDFLVG